MQNLKLAKARQAGAPSRLLLWALLFWSVACILTCDTPDIVRNKALEDVHVLLVVQMDRLVALIQNHCIQSQILVSRVFRKVAEPGALVA